MVKKLKYSHLSREQLEAKLEKLEQTRHYGLIWEDKEEDVAKQCEVELPVLEEDTSREILKDASKNYNFIIEGDNYHSLYTLNFTHKKKIDVIYIDPPYNTGKSNEWKYNDHWVDENDSYKHSKWLSFMSKRLRLARRLLKDSGVIFLSIDDKEFAQLKLLCDSIFGENNYLGDIIWNSTKSVTNTAIISVAHTYNLVYFKDMGYWIKNRKRFRLQENGSGFSNPDNDPRGDWKADPFQVGGWRPNQQYEIVNPKTGKKYLPNEGCSWKNDFTKFKELLQDNRIVFGKSGKGAPQRKRFLSEAIERGRVVKTIWDDIETTTNGTQLLKKMFGTSVFENPKPVELIRRMLELTTSKEEPSIVLDFFAGSGTTGHAVLSLNEEDGGNRQFILCTNNENNICEEVTYPRIKKVIDGYDGRVGTPANVKYFKQTFVPTVTSDQGKRELVNRSTELLCMAENTFESVVKRSKKDDFAIFKSSTQQTVIIYDEEGVDKCVSKLNEMQTNLKTIIYTFSYDHTYEIEDFENLRVDFVVKPIPEAILNIYRKISKMRKK